MLDVDVDVDVDKLSALITQWNLGGKTARDNLIVYLQPLIKRFSVLEFNNGRVVSTPLKLFDVSDIAQTVSIKLLERQPYMRLKGADDFLILLRRMVYNALVDEARKITRAGQGVGDRIKIDNCESSIVNENLSLKIDHTFLLLDKAIARLEEQAKQQALAFILHRFFDLKIADIILILNVSESTFYRYLAFADAFIKKQLVDSEDNG